MCLNIAAIEEITQIKAHFIASTLNIDFDIEIYRRIISILNHHGVTLTRDWIDSAYKRRMSGETSSGSEEAGVSWSSLYRENVEAINKADIVVAEVSNRSFLVGFQVANAIQMKKPVLLLSRRSNANTALGASLNEDVIKFGKYNNETLETIIIEFLKENSPNQKDIRFNLFLSRRLLNYLNWATLRSGETKSEYVRKLLQSDMDASDY